MESSLALGRLELTPSPAPVGVNLTPRLSGGAPAKDKSGQRAVGLQSPAHLNGCVPLSHQVAGHKYGVDKVGILQHPDGTVLKQLQPPPRGPRELQFYSMVYAEDCCDPCLLDLQNYLPKYYGTWSSPDSANDLYLKLEDVTRRFIKPCIMDVKLGQRSYDPFASQEKREQQIRKYPLMEEIGFLVLGMRVYKMCSDSFDTYDQHYGRGLVKETIKDGLAKFFHNGVSLRKDALSASIRRVQQILQWFESQQQLTFYASSLLFVYEGLSSPFSSSSLSSLLSRSGQEEGMAEYNNNNIQVAVPWDYSLATAIYTNHRKGGDHHSAKALWEEDNSAWKRRVELQQAPNGNGNKSQLEGEDEDEEIEVRMIDFAHVFPSDSHDHGYIYGLKHLLTVLEQMLCDNT
uniref:Kinase n=1 Tax=Stegastes partitus TaxID=144197 RepID=A0A3B5A453_9TELE